MTAQPAAPLPALTLQFEQPQDGPAVDDLIARAFGPGRFTKVSERVREIATFAPELSVCAWSQERLLGCARMIARACEAAQAAGETHVLLVGDLAYFSRVGFERTAGREVVLPGPVDQNRVLVRALTPDAGEISGLVTGG